MAAGAAISICRSAIGAPWYCQKMYVDFSGKLQRAQIDSQR